MQVADLSESFCNLPIAGFVGVPCSYLQPLINYAISASEFFTAPNEGDAVAMAAGAWLAGKNLAVLMQNSGLGNAVSPLTSLNKVYDIPIIAFTSLRGEINLPDEPQHKLMGQITESLIDLMQFKVVVLDESIKEATRQLNQAFSDYKMGRSSFFIVRKKIFDKEPLVNFQLLHNQKGILQDSFTTDQLPLRREVLKAILDVQSSDLALLSTTGYTSRELFELKDQENNFYMFGSMGCLSSLTLGAASSNNRRKFIAIDGDGALLMRLGNLPTLARYAPDNVFHLLIDNGQHESTGGQPTVSEKINYSQLAQAAGFSKSICLHSLIELQDALQEWNTRPTCTFACIKIKPGTTPNLSRPNLSPIEIATRFRSFLNPS